MLGFVLKSCGVKSWRESMPDPSSLFLRLFALLRDARLRGKKIAHPCPSCNRPRSVW